MPASKISADEKRWRAESDARTLKEAMSIKSDAKRMKAAKDYCMNEMKALNTITSIGKKKSK